MRFLTARQRAEGRGSAHAGVEHHWSMTVSSVALALLMPVWVVILGRTIGGTQAEVQAAFANPFMAILTALVLVVGMRHFAMGATTLIEDYWRGGTRRALIMLAYFAASVIAATGLFALARIAL